MARCAPFVQVVGVSVLMTLAGQTGCGTDPVGTDACRKIEQARCRKAASCPELGLQGEVGVQECTQFARDRCLHGLAVVDPGPAAVDRCVTAIDHDCVAAAAPESSASCAFLQTTAGTEDGGPEASSDASGEAAVDANPNP